MMNEVDKVKSEIEFLKRQIENIKRVNPYDGELSFYVFQLRTAEKELDQLLNGGIEMADDELREVKAGMPVDEIEMPRRK